MVVEQSAPLPDRRRWGNLSRVAAPAPSIIPKQQCVSYLTFDPGSAFL